MRRSNDMRNGLRNPPGPDLVHAGAEERVVLRDAVATVAGVVAEGVDAEDLAEEVSRREALAVAPRGVPHADVVRGAAVAHRDVEQALPVEDQRPAVVVELGLVDPEQLPGARRVEHEVPRLRVHDAPLGQDALAVRGDAGRQRGEVRRARGRLGREGVEQPVVLELGVERETQQPALVVAPEDAEADEPPGEVGEEPLASGALPRDVDVPDRAVLVGDEEAVVVAGRHRRGRGREHPVGDRLERHGDAARGNGSGDGVGELRALGARRAGGEERGEDPERVSPVRRHASTFLSCWFHLDGGAHAPPRRGGDTRARRRRTQKRPSSPPTFFAFERMFSILPFR